MATGTPEIGDEPALATRPGGEYDARKQVAQGGIWGEDGVRGREGVNRGHDADGVWMGRGGGERGCRWDEVGGGGGGAGLNRVTLRLEQRLAHHVGQFEPSEHHRPRRHDARHQRRRADERQLRPRREPCVWRRDAYQQFGVLRGCIVGGGGWSRACCGGCCWRAAQQVGGWRLVQRVGPDYDLWGWSMRARLAVEPGGGFS